MLRVSVIVLVFAVYTLGGPSFHRADIKMVIEEKQSILASVAETTTPEPLRMWPTDVPVNTSNSSEMLYIANRMNVDDYLLRTPKLDCDK